MATKYPWDKWYHLDWLGDPELSRCRPATRGIWVDALSAMMASGRTGKITGTIEELAKICRCLPAEMAEAIKNLAETNCASVTKVQRKITLKNRRMMREHEKRQLAHRRLVRHRSKKMKRACNGDETGEKSDIRSQKSEREEKTTTSLPPREEEKPEPKIDPPSDPPGPLPVPSEPDPLDEQIRRYIGGHRMLTYDPRTHGKCLQLVKAVGWDHARELIDRGVAEGVAFPVGWALGVAEGESRQAAAPRRKTAHERRMEETFAMLDAMGNEGGGKDEGKK